jgi:7-cyano-7-deazaguanine synthase
MRKKSVILSFSGGADSTILLHLAAKQFENVHAVSFDYGQRHKRELLCAEQQLSSIPNLIQYNILTLPFIEQYKTSALTNNDINVPKTQHVMGDPQTSAYIPNRNMTFLSILIGIAEDRDIDTVWYGAAQADSVAGFYDGSPEFLTAINNITDLNRRDKINVEAPLIDKSKKEIIEMGIELGVDFSRTWTCYEGLDQACGECTACSLRLQGFIQAKVKDPLSYSKDIPWNKLLA